MPVAGTDVLAVRAATAVEDDSEDDQADDGENLDDGEPEFALAVDARAAKVDGAGDDEADGDPDRGVGVGPVRDEDGGGVQFGGKDDDPVVLRIGDW